jgi:flagellin
MYIEAMDAVSLGLRSVKGSNVINVMHQSGTDITGLLDTIDEALSMTTTERAKLGAMQNRLEFTMNYLDVSAENLQSAESRISDADMAKEMMELTRMNVLEQAGITMLSQAANQSSKAVLALLQ